MFFTQLCVNIHIETSPNWFSSGLLVSVKIIGVPNLGKKIQSTFTILFSHVLLKHKIQLSLYSNRCCVVPCGSSILVLSALKCDKMIVGSGGLKPLAWSRRRIPPLDPRFPRVNVRAVDLKQSRRISDAYVQFCCGSRPSCSNSTLPYMILEDSVCISTRQSRVIPNKSPKLVPLYIFPWAHSP